MSLFEIIMLLCFGAAWPASLYRSWRSKSTAGKSIAFLIIVLMGYLAGITHKLMYSPDLVTLLYGLNAAMVAADIALYARNRAIERRASAFRRHSPV